MTDKYVGYYSRRFTLGEQDPQPLSTTQLYDQALGTLLLATQNQLASPEVVENEYRNISIIGSIALQRGALSRSHAERLKVMRYVAHAYATERSETLGPMHAARIGGHYDAFKTAIEVGIGDTSDLIDGMQEATRGLRSGTEGAYEAICRTSVQAIAGYGSENSPGGVSYHRDFQVAKRLVLGEAIQLTDTQPEVAAHLRGLHDLMGGIELAYRDQAL